MTIHVAFILTLFILCTACSSSTTDKSQIIISADSSAAPNRIADSSYSKTITQTDTLRAIKPDNYSITNKMLNEAKSGDSYTLQSGQIISHDKAWFSNDTLRQTIIFEIATDYHRLQIFHFFTNEIPIELIHRINKVTKAGELADNVEKEKSMKGFLSQSQQLSKEYFETDKGFKLTVSKKDQAIKIYGQPDSTRNKGGYQIYYWSFAGSIDNSSINQTKKPIATNSFGYHVTMFFKKDNLFAQILENDIP